MKWEVGRQNSGYFKKKLLESKKLLFDVYLLKFPQGTMVHSHTDPAVAGFEHHRINVVYWPAKNGGKLWVKGQVTNGRIVKFRPDIQSHGMTMVYLGTQYILSIGWLRKEKDEFSEYEPIY